MIKRKPYYPVLCYHGCVTTRSQVLLYREHIDDFIGQVQNYIQLGYTPVLPSVYMSWRNGTYTPPTPIFLITIDDGLDTLRVFADWCVSQKIPFGLALITSRQHKHIPEEDFVSWAAVSAYVASGYCEVMCHTHDMHSLAPILDQGGDFGSVVSATGTTVTLDPGADSTTGIYIGQTLTITGGTGAGQSVMVKAYNGSTKIATIVGSWTITPDSTSKWNIGQVTSSPVLEGPCWLDNGMVVHRDSGDTRYSWDNSYTANCFGFPLLGTDPYDGTTKIISTVTFTPATSFRLNVIRFVSTLVVPTAGGYDAQVEIKLNGVVCDTVIVRRKNYGFIVQWPEREIVSINLPNSTQITNAGVTNTITFTTLNAGGAVLRCYFYPGPSTASVSAQTNCLSLVSGVISPANADQPGNVPWTGKPLMTLGDGTGAPETEANYTAYVQADMLKFQADVQDWLNAVWTSVRYDPPEPAAGFEAFPIFGMNASNLPLDPVIMPWSGATRGAITGKVVETLQMKMCGIYNPSGARPYSLVIKIEVSTVSALGPWQDGYYGLANWNEFRWVEYDVEPFTVGAGDIFWTKITSITPSQWGQGEIAARIYDNVAETITVGTLSAQKFSATIPRYFVYPFGGTYEIGDTLFTRPTNTEDIAPAFKTALLAGGDGCNCGFTITPKRAAVDTDYREPDAGGTVWVLGRQILYGTNDPPVSIQHNDIYAGQFFPDARHGGVIWETAIEANPGGCASILQSWPILDRVYFDTYNFDDAGNIVEGIINDGGTYCQFDVAPAGNYTIGETVTQTPSGYTATVVWSSRDALKITGMSTPWLPSTVTTPQIVTGSTSGMVGTLDFGGAVTYADDKGFLESHSVPCFLIFFNYNPEVGDIDPDIASYVVNNPAIYIPPIVARVVADGWAGCMYDIEATPQADRAAATYFIQQLYIALHAVDKQLCVAVPLFTNTAYDIGSEDFWGWCDFSEIIASCDFMLCESYLENSGTLPGAACPDEIFNLYYRYLESACYMPYWDRIRVGCNIYGQYWPNKNSEDDTSYDSYHVGYANLIYGGTLGTVESTELHFQDRLGGEGWYGTPLTIQRAVQKASDQNYGGIFIWEADKGDKYEMWPSARGPRERSVNFIEEVIPIGQCYFCLDDMAWKTTVVQSFNGKVNAVKNWDRPLSKFTIQARDILPIDTTTVMGDYLRLRDFWRCVVQGQGNGFRFRFNEDCTLTNELIGTGDGATHTFQITQTRTFGSSSFTRNIYKPATYAGTTAPVVKLNGVTQSSGYTLSSTTGQVSFAVAPTAGVLITVTLTFDTPVMSTTDEFPMSFDMEFALPGLNDFVLAEIDPS